MMNVDERLERASRVIAELRRKLGELGGGNDPIAIIGMACRFPGGANDPDAFWSAVASGVNAVGDPGPARREPGLPARPAAYLDDIAGFDAAFFDVSPREALQMDPQQRLFLEVAWEALEDAGQTQRELDGSDTGTFAGVHNHSAGYYELLKSFGATNEFSTLGSAHEVIAGRLAYVLNAHGPTAVINTACSSSLVAIHLACEALQAGSCRMAVAGGVNLVFASDEAFEPAGMIAPDGRCKTFDARADGFGRGEGCGAVVLKRLSHARADRDRVLAIVRASVTNQDGRTNGLTAPSGIAQRALLRNALERAQLEPQAITYLEAHGTGTSLGDPIEIEAVADVYGAPAPGAAPLALGSAKANVNHLEGAAGVAGVIKAVLALRARTIPKLAGFERLNPHLSLEGSRLFVPRETMPWRTPDGTPRIAAVSSFGWSGTNAHVILEEAPDAQPRPPRATGATIIVASTADPRSLPARLEALAARLEAIAEDELDDFAWTAARRRTHFEHRAAVVGSDRRSLIDALRARAADPATAGRDTSELDVLARRFEAGENVDWDTVFAPDARLVPLPAYPFRKRRYWIGDEFAPAPRAAEPSAQAVASAPDDWFFETRWERVAAAAQRVPAFARWLVIADRGGFGHAFAAMARAEGDEVVLAQPGDSLGGSIEGVDANGSRVGVVDLRALDASGDAEPATALRLAEQLIALDDALGARAWTQPPALFVVTRGAQAPLPFEPPSGLAAANLWGLGRCIGLDHPERWGGLIDLDPVASPGDAAALFAQLRAGDDETDVALRNGERFVARLEPAAAPPAGAVAFRADASYLVTGAFGAVGTELARWLVACGAKQLVLTGRASASGSAAAALRDELQERGASVRIEACDVGDEAQLSALWSRLQAELPPVRGIFHLAGATERSETLSARDLADAFAAKVGGTLALDRLSAAQPLDHFVCFSSGAAVIGDRGRAAYGAANAFMDALVADRRGRGLAGISINWGLWSGRDESSAEAQLFIRSGLVAMPFGAAFDALGRVMRADEPRVNWEPLIAALDVPRLVAALATRGRRAFLSALAPAQPAVSVEASSAVVDEIRRADATERDALLADAIAREVRAVLELADDDRLDPERGFFDLGMDSLMTVALKGRLERVLGVSLPSTLTMEYPTVTALAAYIGRAIIGDGHAARDAAVTAASAPGAAAPIGPSADEAVEALDDAAVSDALAAELRALELELQG